MSLDLEFLLRPEREPVRLPNNLVTSLPDQSFAELAINRNAQARLEKRCAVLRAKMVKDNTGGSTSTFVQIGGYECAVEPILKPETSSNGEGGNLTLQSDATHWLYLPLDADVIPEDRVGTPAWFNTWKANTPLAVGDKIIPTRRGGNGHFYVVVKAGTTGVTEPTVGSSDYPTTRGATFMSGSVGLREAGYAEFFSVIGTNRGETDAIQLRCLVKNVS